MQQTRHRPDTAEPAILFQRWIERLSAAASAVDAAAFAGLFDTDGYWKDLLAFSWTFKTFAGPSEIAAAFAATAPATGMRNVRVAEGRAEPVFVRRSGRSLLEGYLAFDTAVGTGAGFVRMFCDPDASAEPKAWQLLTTLQALHGYEERVGVRRPTGEKYSKLDSTESWRQKRDREGAFADREPQVVIIGAGQGGLMLAARLHQMRVDTLVLEKTARVGDVWRQRYNNLTLHNELTANHFPYMPFPDNWPVWLPKDMLAEWLEAYAEFQELNVWTGTTLIGSDYDEDAGAWTIDVRRPDGSVRRLRPRHLVAAMGLSGGTPRKARLPGLSDFKGTVMHSSEFRSGADWTGKRAIVVGTGNSGHDLAQDLHAGGADVTLMQRGPTCVVSLDPSAKISYAVYGEGRSTEDADLMVAAIPYPVLIDTYQWITRTTDRLDAELLEQLRGAGFRLTSGEDGTGFQLLYLRGAGGYYIDVGCSRLIIERKVGLLQAEAMDSFVQGGVRLRDGSVLPCDLVVLATGFETMQEGIRAMLGDTVADRVGPIWGFDEDHNMRNMWKRTRQPGFWIMGGAIIEARLFSRFLALQIRASLDGMISGVNHSGSFPCCDRGDDVWLGGERVPEGSS